MDCSICKQKAYCVDTATSGRITYRKYRCSVCGKVFYSSERVDGRAKYALNNIRHKRRTKKEKETTV